MSLLKKYKKVFIKRVFKGSNRQHFEKPNAGIDSPDNFSLKSGTKYLVWTGMALYHF